MGVLPSWNQFPGILVVARADPMRAVAPKMDENFILKYRMILACETIR